MKSDRISRIQKEALATRVAQEKKHSEVHEAIARARKAVLDEHFDRTTGRGRVVALALTEAEALAWQTDFPHLFFPALAEEKIQAALVWEQRQRSMKLQPGEVAFAE